MKRPRLRRPVAHFPHPSGLYELERLADDAVTLSVQIKRTVAELRAQQEQRGDSDHAADE